jgi:hypothetical protein
MTGYSEAMVITWMIPVLLQIVLPLMMLVVYGIVKVIQILFFGKVKVHMRSNDLTAPKLQPSTA